MTSTNLRVAVVGAGPGGLATAIALSAVLNVEVTVYEQATKLREIGSGITIGLNGWRVLELLGAAGAVTGHRRIIIDHRYAPVNKSHAAGCTYLRKTNYILRVFASKKITRRNRVLIFHFLL